MPARDVPGDSREVTVAELLDVLAPVGLRLASGPSGLALPVAKPAVHDPLSPLPLVRAGLLLCVGLDPGSPTAPGLVDEAAGRGFSVLVVKDRGSALGALATAADRTGLALLVVDDGVDWRQLDSLVTSAVVAGSQAGRSLSTQPIGDLFALSNAVAAMVGGAAAVEDLQQRVLAYSTLPHQPIDEDRRQGILGRQVPDLPENDEQYRALFRQSRAIRFPATPPALSRLAVAVRAGSELLGSIWVVDDGDLSPEADRDLERAAEIAALHLLRARSGEDLGRQQRGELLRDLLERPGEPGAAVDQLGLAPGGPFAVLAFRPQSGPGRADELAVTRLVDLVALHCEAHQGRTGCVALGGTVYALLGSGAGAGPGRLAGLAGEVVGRARTSLRTEVLAAVGTVVDDVAAVSQSRRDADLVLRLLTERPQLRPVASAASLHSSLALVELAQLLADNPRLASPKARVVLDHDRRRGSTYAQTLQAYLDHAQDARAAAAELSLHPNTLRYRVRRAAGLFGLDLTDPEEVLALWLTLRAGRSVSARPSPRPAGTP